MPTELFSSPTATFDAIAVDPSALYLSWGDKLMTLALDGGTPALLSSPVEPLSSAAVDDQNVYVSGDATLTRISKESGAQTVLASGLYWPIDLTLDATSGYGVTGEGVIKFDLASGAVSWLVPDTTDGGEGNIIRIAIDQTSLYWTNQSCGTVSKRSKL
jgi:hypothetical protein